MDHYFDIVMTKSLVNTTLTPIVLFTITNCQIVHNCSFPHRINYKFVCLSALILPIKISPLSATIFAGIVKNSIAACFTLRSSISFNPCLLQKLPCYVVHSTEEENLLVQVIMKLKNSVFYKREHAQAADRQLWGLLPSLERYSHNTNIPTAFLCKKKTFMFELISVACHLHVSGIFCLKFTAKINQCNGGEIAKQTL